MRTLDLGCGGNKTPGAFGIDKVGGRDVDLVHDLSIRPWPLETGAFDRVIAHHLVEHLEDVVGFFEETHRVCADGAQVSVLTPHYSNRCAYLDPTHRHAFSARFAELIAPGKPWRPAGKFALARSFLLEHHHDYQPLLEGRRYSIISVELSFARLFRWMGVRALANWKIDFYEFYLCALLPARDIRLLLRVHKDSERA